jgi:hypothetical protein
MTKYEKGVRELIALNTRYTFEEIQLTDKLDKFFSPFMADVLAGEIKRKFSKIDMTSITNALFVSVKTVSDLVANVSSYYA